MPKKGKFSIFRKNIWQYSIYKETVFRAIHFLQFLQLFPGIGMLIRVAVEGTDRLNIIIITGAFNVKISMKAAKLEFLTPMFWKEAVGQQNCLTVFLKLSPSGGGNDLFLLVSGYPHIPCSFSLPCSYL